MHWQYFPQRRCRALEGTLVTWLSSARFSARDHEAAQDLGVSLGVALAGVSDPTLQLGSCNHHGDCLAVDAKHPGGGHCCDPECEVGVAESCPNVWSEVEP